MKAPLLVIFSFFACCSVFATELLPGPGGYYHPDCHVVLQPGARMVDHETIVLADGTTQHIPPCKHNITSRGDLSTRGQKREADGWNTYSRYFMNAYLDLFNGDWYVPNNPAGGYRGQTLAFFTGLEDAACNCILQPAVWYGPTAAGGGAFWSAAVWYVYNNNANLVTSPVITVNPGDFLATYMQRAAGTGWYAGIYVNNNLATSGLFPDVLQSNAYCTMEVYGVSDCGSFPYYQATTFQNLAIIQDGVGPVGFNNADWNIYVTQTDCHQSMSCNGNECTMVYGSAFPCPGNIGSTLGNGQSMSSSGTNWLVSDGCYYRTIIQGDGNLVLLDAYNEVLWNAGSGGHSAAPFNLIMQGDGNLVIYDANGTPIWNTGTFGQGYGPYNLVQQGDGNLVIYDGAGAALWNTGT